MALVCRNCSRVNPPEAQYCYWDGAVLDGRAQASGPIAVGAQPFHSPFVFPTGRQCRNFDELVLACHSEWKEALDLLREGYLEGFFGSQGRADLALAAKQASRIADVDVGLDRLLGKLPCGNREPAKLSVQPLEVNLGQVPRSSDRRFELRIENQGMALLQGTVACDDTAWLMLGEGSGSPRKVFQCLNEFKLLVQVHGKALRAGNKTLEGRLTIESNGGDLVVVVRADVPVQPFPDGVLAGALSPRQVAEKAKANPKGAAPYFEKGTVAAWYESNGWTYPVQGPAASGLGAIQQFFEALGLVRVPVVEISETVVQLHGAPGAALEHVLQLRAQEKRPVFAHATTGAPWMQIGPIVLDGRTARIPVKVPNVPARPGEQLQGKVQVTANGGQRFLVEVALAISGRMSGHVDRLPGGVLDVIPMLAEAPVLTSQEMVSTTETVPDVLPIFEEITAAPHRGHREILEVVPANGGHLANRQHPQPGVFHPAAGATGSPTLLKHLLPLGVLALLLLIVLAHDLWLIVAQPAGDDAGLLDPQPFLAIHFHDGSKEAKSAAGKNDPMPEPTMRFGLVMLREKDPKNPERLKKLTFDEMGRSNNTVLLVDGRQYLFGQRNPARLGFDETDPRGEWIERKIKLTGEISGRPRDGYASTWWLPGRKLRVTQEVEIVAGTQSRLLDTCLVRYVLENRDTISHRAGLRFMLDTFIGANDGVPFTIPGASDQCNTKKMFDKPAEVPDFIQALERDNPRDPGTVAYVQFRIGKQIESPSRVVLGGWPNPALFAINVKGAEAQLTGWEVPFISMKERVPEKRGNRTGRVPMDDSAVTMYWNEQPLEPGKSRVVGFTYGLGSVDTRESGGHLLLTVGGRLVRRGEFTLTALVHDPQPGERLTLNLPAGFERIGGEAQQTVPPVPPGASRPDSPVTWRLRAGEDGKHELSVTSSSGAKQKLPILIRTHGVFD